MKKTLKYIVATLLLVSGYTTVNAQYGEFGPPGDPWFGQGPYGGGYGGSSGGGSGGRHSGGGYGSSNSGGGYSGGGNFSGGSSPNAGNNSDDLWNVDQAGGHDPGDLKEVIISNDNDFDFEPIVTFGNSPPVNDVNPGNSGSGFVGSSSGSNNTSSSGSNNIDEREDLGRCDEGFTKNINGECVPCPGGNCGDCADGEFRDICGKCSKSLVTKPKIVNGRCNAIQTMKKIQKETGKEIAGFFTSSGKMIILPNNDPRQSSNRSITEDRYKNSSGITIINFFKNGNGQWRVNYYDSDGQWESAEDVVGHFHTHPPGGGFSDQDKAFTQGSFSGIDHYYNIQGNSINEFNSTGVINTETKNCKRNPEPVNNCN